MLFTVDTRLLLKYYNIHYNLLRSADLDSGARTIQNAVYVDLESHKIAFSYIHTVCSVYMHIACMISVSGTITKGLQVCFAHYVHIHHMHIN